MGSRDLSIVSVNRKGFQGVKKVSELLQEVSGIFQEFQGTSGALHKDLRNFRGLREPRGVSVGSRWSQECSRLSQGGFRGP